MTLALLLGLVLASLLVARLWREYFRLVHRGSVSVDVAINGFRKGAVSQFVLGGTVHFWVIAFLISAKIENIHSAAALPIAGFLLGAILGTAAAMIGIYAMRKQIDGPA